VILSEGSEEEFQFAMDIALVAGGFGFVCGSRKHSLPFYQVVSLAFQ
jgi:hypothetical protein